MDKKLETFIKAVKLEYLKNGKSEDFLKAVDFICNSKNVELIKKFISETKNLRGIETTELSKAISYYGTSFDIINYLEINNNIKEDINILFEGIIKSNNSYNTFKFLMLTKDNHYLSNENKIALLKYVINLNDANMLAEILGSNSFSNEQKSMIIKSVCIAGDGNVALELTNQLPGLNEKVINKFADLVLNSNKPMDFALVYKFARHAFEVHALTDEQTNRFVDLFSSQKNVEYLINFASKVKNLTPDSINKIYATVLNQHDVHIMYHLAKKVPPTNIDQVNMLVNTICTKDYVGTSAFKLLMDYRNLFSNIIPEGSTIELEHKKKLFNTLVKTNNLTCIYNYLTKHKPSIQEQNMLVDALIRINNPLYLYLTVVNQQKLTIENISKLTEAICRNGDFNYIYKLVKEAKATITPDDLAKCIKAVSKMSAKNIYDFTLLIDNMLLPPYAISRLTRAICNTKDQEMIKLFKENVKLSKEDEEYINNALNALETENLLFIKKIIEPKKSSKKSDISSITTSDDEGLHI